MSHNNATLVIVAVLVHICCSTVSWAQDFVTSSSDALTTTLVAGEETTASQEVDTHTTQSTVSISSHSIITASATSSADSPTSLTLPGGIYYQIIKAGAGPLATTTGTRQIHYTLYLTDGQKLESSREAEFPIPFSFKPGESQAIKGMEVGTNDMNVGEVRKLYVPSNLGYGDKGQGNVPPNSDLVFEIELVDIK